MTNVAILLLTIWLSNGEVTARAVVAPDIAMCEAAKPAIIEQVMKVKGMNVAGESLTISYVDGYCYAAVRGQRASR